MRLARFLLLFSVFVSLSSEFSTAFARRVEECGQETVIFHSGPSCEPIYFAQSSMACPGSVASDNYYRCISQYPDGSSPQGFGDCESAPRCRVGYNPLPHSNDGGKSFRQFCIRPERPAQCQLPQFGIQSYKACIPEIVWNDCSIRKTRVELDAFLASMEAATPALADLYVSNKALIAKIDNNADALACIIKDWDENPIHQALVDQLKGDFLAMAGTKYTMQACKSDVILRFSCDQTPEADVCKAQAATDNARTYFSEQLAEVTALQSDVVARSSTDYKARLDAAAVQLEKYTK